MATSTGNEMQILRGDMMLRNKEVFLYPAPHRSIVCTLYCLLTNSWYTCSTWWIIYSEFKVYEIDLYCLNLNIFIFYIERFPNNCFYNHNQLVFLTPPPQEVQSRAQSFQLDRFRINVLYLSAWVCIHQFSVSSIHWSH